MKITLAETFNIKVSNFENRVFELIEKENIKKLKYVLSVFDEERDADALQQKGLTINYLAGDRHFGHGFLHHAVTHNQETDIVELLLAKGADINLKTKKGLTPLELAVSRDSLSFVNFLIERNANPNIFGGQLSPLVEAIRNSDEFIASRLIHVKADVNWEDADGMSPLMWASMKGNVDVCKRLLERGATINHAMKNSLTTSLHLAAIWGSEDVLTLLLSKDADVNAQDINGLGALHHALIRNKENDMIHSILEHPKVIVDIKTKEEETPLMFAAITKNSEAIKLLIEKGAKVNLKNKEKNTALHIAVDNNDIDSVRVLVNAGADINAKNDFKQTPMQMAVNNDDEELVAVLKKDQVVRAIKALSKFGF